MRGLATRWLPRRTVRLRLTVLYGSLFLLAGALLLTITYLLVASNIDGSNQSDVSIQRSGSVSVSAAPGVSLPNPIRLPAGAAPAPNQGFAYVRTSSKSGAGPQIAAGGFSSGSALQIPVKEITKARLLFNSVLHRERSHELDQLVLWSGTGLAIMALLSALLGWLMAGRVLAPLREMTAAARHISAENLHERLAHDGPDDELKEMGDTFDGLLGRLEGAFEAQRRFVANASHELRTPLTLERAMIEVALADPDTDIDSLRAVCERVLLVGEQQEHLIEALLVLARSERGLHRREPLDLAPVVEESLIGAATTPRITAELQPAPLAGDRRLIERLVGNLLDNAVRHNVPGGWVRVCTRMRGGSASVLVSNSGPVVDPDEVQALLEPFRRAAPARAHQPGSGHGLGLSIVAAIAAAHGAELAVHALPEGGLGVEVRFPPLPSGATLPAAVRAPTVAPLPAA
ncbi:MAG TPA: ATP-binding protein [Solirubrobacteraceae bacterium]|nr:ATP-binding protein [Solirubrobacteraceae bacterium]